MHCRFRKTALVLELFMPGGTMSSNLLSSTGESTANLSPFLPTQVQKFGITAAQGSCHRQRLPVRQWLQIGRRPPVRMGV
jgi:hypothetical protein